MTDIPDEARIPKKSMFNRCLSGSLKDGSLNTVGSNLCRPNQNPNCPIYYYDDDDDPIFIDQPGSELCSDLSLITDVTPPIWSDPIYCPTKR